MATERRGIQVRGVVQGVGFRPFVYNLAGQCHLHGFVRNQTGTVLIEVEGEPDQLDAFGQALTRRPPPLARIEEVAFRPLAPRGDQQFRIEASDGDARGSIFISPDVATCEACLAEIRDPGDRRYRYAFTNCTHCGPRLTLITDAPYDRSHTTMAGFPMCEACQREYEDPRDRRFHAQPIACPDCGPHLSLHNAAGDPISTDDPLAGFVEALSEGKIGALKGLGGFHLVCHAHDDAVVALLRQRKRRDDKPLAVMTACVGSAEALCEINEAERKLLISPRRPIVLLRKRRGCGVVEAVAPGNPWLGVMLPYTPLHHLLMETVETEGRRCVVMTSGNRSDEPIAYHNDEAVKRLGETAGGDGKIADIFLMHDRPIHVRCDDSVTRVLAGGAGGVELPLRRSRGSAPQPLRLPEPCRRPTLAVGGQLKNTFALGRDRQAFVSHHVGDLDHFAAYRAFEKDVALYERLFDVQPQVIVHDLHPDYASTRYAVGRVSGAVGRASGAVGRASRPSSAQRAELIRQPTRTCFAPSGQDGRDARPTLLAVQHHHAHMASCMAEHGLTEPVIGVCFDGTGYGTDGAVWGGEFLVGDYGGFERGAHLRYVPMPGGEQAIREPWRMAAAHLLDGDGSLDMLAGRVSPEKLRIVKRMIERRVRSPLTSSAGRLFDAAAAIIGVRDVANYEGQAAIELEHLAASASANAEQNHEDAYPCKLIRDGDEPATSAPLVLDTRPLIRAVADDVRNHRDAAAIARCFHITMTKIVLDVCERLRQTRGLNTVVLSGGVFQNTLLTCQAMTCLTDAGFRAYRHQHVPPNDGGLSLGQLAVAASRLPAEAVAGELANNIKSQGADPCV